MREKILKIRKLIGRIAKENIRYIILILFCCVSYLCWYYIKNNILIDIPEAVVQYCEEKYNNQFYWKDFDTENSGTTSRVSIVSDGEVCFHVNRYYTTEKVLCYKDDYYSHKYEKDIEREIYSYLPENSTASLLVEETTIGGIEKDNINVGDLLRAEDTTLVMSISSDHLWSMEEALSFSENFPCKLSVFLYGNGSNSHFIYRDGEIVFR